MRWILPFRRFKFGDPGSMVPGLLVPERGACQRPPERAFCSQGNPEAPPHSLVSGPCGTGRGSCPSPGPRYIKNRVPPRAPPDEPGRPGGRRGRRGQEAGWPRRRGRPPLRPDTRVGSDPEDPHRSRGSYPPPAAAVRSANLVEWAIHLGRGPSAEPPVLPPLRSPAASLKAAHWPLLLCAACHALAWTPTSWCGPGNLARKTRRCSGTQTWASPLSSAHRRVCAQCRQRWPLCYGCGVRGFHPLR